MTGLIQNYERKRLTKSKWCGVEWTLCGLGRYQISPLDRGCVT